MTDLITNANINFLIDKLISTYPFIHSCGSNEVKYHYPPVVVNGCHYSIILYESKHYEHKILSIGKFQKSYLRDYRSFTHIYLTEKKYNLFDSLLKEINKLFRNNDKINSLIANIYLSINESGAKSLVS